MDKDLRSYLKIYKGFLDLKQCKKTVKELKAAVYHKHAYYDVKKDDHKTFNTDLSVTYQNVSTTPYLMKRTWDSLEQYILKDFNFDWHSGWNGYMQIRFNKYEVGTEMRNHCDHIHSLFDGMRKGVPILTILGILNEDFEGGELVMFDDEKLDVKTGDLLVFPSNFLFPHRVDPVTTGVRYSFVSWSW